MSTVALIVAAGRGVRAGGGTPKQYRRLAGVPVLRRTVRAFLRHPGIDLVRCVVHPDDKALYAAATHGLALADPAMGRATRQGSVLAGLEMSSGSKWVLIHDAARPLLPSGVIDRVLEALEAGATGAVPVLPVVDTLCESDGGTVAREGLLRVQTPQGFDYTAIIAAHRATSDNHATDDAGLLRRVGLEVALVPGDELAMKLTDEADFLRAEALLGSAMLTRVGTGFDVHAFAPGDHIMLCGLRLEHDQGVLAHSDGDVGLHALTDAIFGALGDGDIGQHFPPANERWRGAASDQFLVHAGELVAARGGVIDHLDLTIICERPKVGPHRDRMRVRVAEILRLSFDQVSIKATTTEALGFTGRREGIAAQAAATLRLPL